MPAPVTAPLDEAAASGAGRGQPVVAVRVGPHRFALPLEAVREVQQIVEFAPAPSPDPPVLGLVSIRGKVVPAVDLGLLVGAGPVAQRLDTPMLVCGTETGSACFLVDEVCDIVEAPGADALLAGGATVAFEGALGAWSAPDGITVLLDAGRLIGLLAGPAPVAPGADGLSHGGGPR